MTGSARLLDGTSARYQAYVVGGNTRMAAEIEPDESVRISTLDASGNQIRPGMAWPEVDPAALFPVAGPFRLPGVRRGDLVAVDIEGITWGEFGHCWARPGIGMANVEELLVREIDLRSPVIHFEGLRVPLSKRPHIGTLGLAPALATPARDLGAYGGNIDTVHLAEGATLWLEAQADEGGLFVGDVHLGIGDGEICGTGIEIAAEVQIRVRHPEGVAPRVPVVSRDGEVWAIGIGGNLEEALHDAVEYAVSCLRATYGISGGEAYLAASQVMTIDVCQIVNPHSSVALTLGGGLAGCLLPSRTA